MCQDGLSQAMARMQECEGHVKSIKGLVDQCKVSMDRLLEEDVLRIIYRCLAEVSTAKFGEKSNH